MAPLNPSGRTQVDGATQIAELDRTESNRSLVRRFKQLVTVDLRFDLAETLHPRRALLPARLEGGRWHRATEGAHFRGRSRRSEKVLNPRAYFAEGNFVLCLVEAHAATGPTANYDLFRCEDGWIVEHWDVLSRIPPRADWKNDNTPY